MHTRFAPYAPLVVRHLWLIRNVHSVHFWVPRDARGAPQVRDSRIPLATGHPMVPSWIGPSKLRLVVLNQVDKISDKEQNQ